MIKKQYKIKKCLFCGESIEKRQNESIPSYNKRKFCKLSCQHKWNAENKSKDVRCDFCGVVFRRRKSGIKEHNFCSAQCQHRYRTLSRTKVVICDWCGEKYRKKLSEINKTKKNFCSRKCLGEWQAKFLIGENSYNWQGGITSLNHRIRSLKKYIEWMLLVYQRDNYTCQKCGDKKGGNLNAHHRKELGVLIKEKHIKNILDAIQCEAIWDIGNGITLCKKCHQELHNRNL